MTFDEYQEQAIATLTSGHTFGDVDAKLLDQVLGLVGESGEVAEKFKKIIRDKQGIIGEEDKAEIIKELGDILWYVNSVSTLLGSSIGEVASVNIEKVHSRKARGQQHGSGDNR